jgi:hypothetical protein
MTGAAKAEGHPRLKPNHQDAGPSPARDARLLDRLGCRRRRTRARSQGRPGDPGHIDRRSSNVCARRLHTVRDSTSPNADAEKNFSRAGGEGEVCPASGLTIRQRTNHPGRKAERAAEGAASSGRRPTKPKPGARKAPALKEYLRDSRVGASRKTRARARENFARSAPPENCGGQRTAAESVD